ncbi:MAG TPA: transcription termination factor NusA [Thermoclostridium sp.]|nr:transcription termination/antitermination protein NusA [Clostridiaceae bacterium]HOQ76162.1 transcription termination factor NusA [Thermoclostridium sp.]HPU44881.1 transcription termination factor NusA [Thermoclostridium sp.]
MSAELLHALEQLEREKGINKDILVEAIEQALISAYKRNFGSAQNVEVMIDRTTGDVRVFTHKTIVDEVTDPANELSIEQAKRFGADFEVGDIVEVEVTPRKFGRIAAQTAKQVVMQRIREAERGIIYDEFSNREEDIVSGIISRFDRKNIIIDLGRAEAILPPAEQTPGEKYNVHDRIKVYVINVKKTNKNPQIYVSRTHPGLVKRLLELEVPEIADGTVEIKNIAREAGSRTKIAIHSRNEDVDPVGACVGQKGSRIRAIVDELKGEMIDVIKWSSNPEEFIASSLSPAKVVQVDLDEDAKVARVIVPDFQLSLAIGKEGQNARLAAKLTGWKIDIKSESQLRSQIEYELFHPEAVSDDEDEEDYEPEDIHEEDYESEEDTESAADGDEAIDEAEEPEETIDAAEDADDENQ